MKNHLRKILSFILCLAMCMSLFPTAAFATDVDSGTDEGQTYVEPVAETPVEETPAEPTEETPVEEPEATPTPTAEPEATPAPETTPEATPAPESTPTPEVTPNVTPDPEDEEGEDEDEYGIMPLGLDDESEESMTAAESTLVTALSEAASGDTVNMTESVTLTQDLTVPYGVILRLDSGAALTVPDGITLTNNYHIFLPTGTSLTVDVGGVLANTTARQEGGDTTLPCIYLRGGVLTENGTISTDAPFTAQYTAHYYTSLSDATNLSASRVAYFDENITSWDSISAALNEEYASWSFSISGAVSISNGYIPANRIVGIGGGTLTVPSGATFTNNGGLQLFNSCAFTVEAGGTYIGNEPFCTGGATFTNNGNVEANVTSWDEFKAAIESSRTISIRITGSVTLEEDATVPMDIPMTLDGGSLTIPTGMCLTVGARITMQNNSSAEGTPSLTIEEGGVLTLKDPTNAGGWIPTSSISVVDGTVTNNGTINLQTSAGETVTGRAAVQIDLTAGEEHSTSYTGDKSIVEVSYNGVTSAADINTRLAEGYGYYILLTSNASAQSGDMSLAANVTVPTGVCVTMKADVAGTKATYTIPSGVTVTNNGTFTTNGDIVIEAGGKWSGNAPSFTGEGKLTDNNSAPTTTEEDELREAIAAAEEYATVTMTESVTLAQDLTVPKNVYLSIGDGITLTVPSGITLTNNSSIDIAAGGELVIASGATLANVHVDGGFLPNVKLYGGKLTVNGTTSVQPTGMFVAMYDSSKYTAISSATNLTADKLAYLISNTADEQKITGQSIKTLLDANLGFRQYNFMLNGQEVSLVDGTTIPADTIVEFDNGYGSSTFVTVPSGAKLTNNGSIWLSNICFSVEAGGVYAGNAPVCQDDTSSFTDYNAAEEDELREAMANGESFSMTESITLTKDLTIPYSQFLYVDEGVTLTIPNGITLTNKGEVCIFDGEIVVENGGTLANVMAEGEQEPVSKPQVLLDGGKLTVNGTISEEETVNWAAIYCPDSYTSTDLTAATNLPASRLAYLGRLTKSGETVKTILETTSYASYTFETSSYFDSGEYVSCVIDIVDGTTIPTNVEVVFDGSPYGAAITVSSGATFTNNGTLELKNSIDFTVETGGTYIGDEPTCDSTSSFVKNPEEKALREAIAAAEEAEGGMVTVDTDITLTSDLTVPYGVDLRLDSGATLTVPDGITLTNNYNIFLSTGTSLTVDVGGVLANTTVPQETGSTTLPIIHLTGGKLTVNGTISTDAENYWLATYYSDYYTSVAAATNLTTDKLQYQANDNVTGESIKTALSEGYASYNFYLSGDVSLVDGTTVPTGIHVFFVEGAVTLPAGATFTNNGTLILNDACVFTVEDGGTYIGNEPVCDDISSFTDNNKNTTAAENTLREAIADAEAEGGTVTVNENITLTSDLTVNATGGTLKLELAGGKLTIPAGMTLTIGANAQIILAGGKLDGDGTLTLEAGAAARLDADEYTDEGLDAISGGLMSAADVDYFASYADADALCAHLAATGYKSVSLVQADNTTVTLTADAKIPEGTLVDVSDGSSLTVSSGTLTNNGTLQIMGNGAFTVASDAGFVNNGEFKCDYYAATNVGGTISGTNAAQVNVSVSSAEGLRAALNNGAKAITVASKSYLYISESGITIPEGVTVCVEYKAALYFSDGANLVNNGTLNVIGTVDIANNTSLTNNGTINIAGVMDAESIELDNKGRVILHHLATYSGSDPAQGKYTVVTNTVSTAEELYYAQNEDGFDEIIIDGKINLQHYNMFFPEGKVIYINYGGGINVWSDVMIFTVRDTIMLLEGGTLDIATGAKLTVEAKSDGDFPAIELLGGKLTVNGEVELPEGCDSCTTYWADTENYTALKDATNLDKSRVRYGATVSTGAEIKAGVDNTGFAAYHFNINNIKTADGETTNNVDLVSMTIPGNVVFRGDPACKAILYINDGVTVDATAAKRVSLINCDIVLNAGGSYLGPVPNGSDGSQFIDNAHIQYTVSTWDELNTAIKNPATTTIEITGNITLPSNAMIPVPSITKHGRVDVTLSTGGSLTVPSGKELTVTGDIIVKGGSLNVSENATLILADASTDTGSYSYLRIYSGKVTNDGIIVMPRGAADKTYPSPSGKYRIVIGELSGITATNNFSDYYTGDKTNLCIIRTLTSVEDMYTIFKAGTEYGAKHFWFVIGGDATLTDDVTIPADVTVEFGSFAETTPTITIPAGVTVTNYGGLESSANIVVNDGGTYTGTAAKMLGNATFTDKNRPAETVLREEIAEAAKTATAASPATVTLKKSVTLTSNLTVPANVGLDVKGGATLTVPSGKTLTSNDIINIGAGGKVVIEKGGTLKGAVCLAGGTFDVYGITTGASSTVPNVTAYADMYASHEALVAATNLTSEEIDYVHRAADAETVRTALQYVQAPYERYTFVLPESIEFSSSVTIPLPPEYTNGKYVTFVSENYYKNGTHNSDVAINFVPGTGWTNKGGVEFHDVDVNITSGVRLENGNNFELYYSNMTVDYGASFKNKNDLMSVICSKGAINVNGVWFGITPSLFNSSFNVGESATVYGIVTGDNMLTQAINEGWYEITVNGTVTLRAEATLPMGSTFKINEGAKLNIAEGVKLTLHDDLRVYGTLNISGEVEVGYYGNTSGAAMNAILLKGGESGEAITGRVNVLTGGSITRADENKHAISYDYEGKKHTAYTSGVSVDMIEVEDYAPTEARLREIFVTNGYKRAYVELYDWDKDADKTIRLSQSLTIPEGGVLSLYEGQLIVPSGVTLTNNGTICLSGTTVTVQPGGKYVEGANAKIEHSNDSEFIMNGTSLDGVIDTEEELRAAISAGRSAIDINDEIDIAGDLEIPAGVLLRIDGGGLNIAAGKTLTVKGQIGLYNGGTLNVAGTLDVSAAGDTPLVYLAGGSLSVTGKYTHGEKMGIQYYAYAYGTGDTDCPEMDASTLSLGANIEDVKPYVQYYGKQPTADEISRILGETWGDVILEINADVEGEVFCEEMYAENVTFKNFDTENIYTVYSVKCMQARGAHTSITLDGVKLFVTDDAIIMLGRKGLTAKNGGGMIDVDGTACYDGTVDSEADLAAALKIIGSATLTDNVTITGDVHLETRYDYNGSYTPGQIYVPAGKTLTVAKGGTLTFCDGGADIYGSLVLESGSKTFHNKSGEINLFGGTLTDKGVEFGVASKESYSEYHITVMASYYSDYTKAIVDKNASCDTLSFARLDIETAGMSNADATKAIKTALGKGFLRVSVTAESFTLTESITVPAGTRLELDTWGSATVTVPNGVTLTNNGGLKSGVSFLIEEGGAIAGEDIEFTSDSATIINLNKEAPKDEVATADELRTALAAGVANITIVDDITIDGDLAIPADGLALGLLYIDDNKTLKVTGTLEINATVCARPGAQIIANGLRMRSITEGTAFSVPNLVLCGSTLTVNGTYEPAEGWMSKFISIEASAYSDTAANDLFAAAIKGENNIAIGDVQLNVNVKTEEDIRTAFAAGFGGYGFDGYDYQTQSNAEITLTSDLDLKLGLTGYGYCQFYRCTLIVPDGITLTIDERTMLTLSGEEAKLIIKEGGKLVKNGYLEFNMGATLVDENESYTYDGVIDSEDDLRYVLKAGYSPINIQNKITVTKDIDITSLINVVTGGALTINKGVTVNLNEDIEIYQGGTMTVQTGAKVIYGQRETEHGTVDGIIYLHGGKLSAPDASIVVSGDSQKAILFTDAYDNTNKYSSAISGVNKANILANFYVSDAKAIVAAMNAGYGYTNLQFIPDESGKVTLTAGVTIPKDRVVQFIGVNSPSVHFASGTTLTNNGTLRLWCPVYIADGAKYVSGKDAVLYDGGDPTPYLNFLGAASNACTHNWQTAKDAEGNELITPATCDTDGLRTDTCARCGATRTVTIPATGHQIKTVAAVPATCVAEGAKEHRLCVNPGCNYVSIKDTDAEGNVTWSKDDSYIDADDLAEKLKVEKTGHSYVGTAATFFHAGTEICSVCGETSGAAGAAVDRDDWQLPLTININTANAPEGATLNGEAAKLYYAYNSHTPLNLNELVTYDTDSDYELEGWTVERSDGKHFVWIPIEEGSATALAEGWYDPDESGYPATLVTEFEFDASSFTQYDVDVPYTFNDDGVLCNKDGTEYVSFTISAVWGKNEKTIAFERWTTKCDAIDADGNVDYKAEQVAFPIAVPVDSITRTVNEAIFASEADLVKPTTTIPGYTFAGWMLVRGWEDDFIGEVTLGDSINAVIEKNGKEGLRANDELVLRAMYVPSSTSVVAEVEGCWTLYADGTLEIASFDDDKGYKSYAAEITRIELDDSVAELPEKAFEKFTALTAVNLNNVTAVADNVFNGCTALRDIDLHKLTAIGNSAFAGCISLDDVVISSEITSLGSRAFQNTGLKSINLRLVDAYAISNAVGLFEGCTRLEYARVSVPQDGYSLPQEIFKGCTALTNVDLYGFYGVHNWAFAGCTALTGIDLYGLTKIYSYAFQGCTKLASVAFDAAMLGTVDDEGNVNLDTLGTIDSNAFDGCNALKTVYLDGSPTQWTALKASDNIGAGNAKLLSATVKAQKDVTSVTITNVPKYVGVGGTRTLTAKTAPADAYPVNLTWMFCTESGSIYYSAVDENSTVIWNAGGEHYAELNTVTGEIKGLAEGTVYVVAIANGYKVGSAEGQQHWAMSAPIAIEVRSSGITEDAESIVLPDVGSEATSRYWFSDGEGGYSFALEGNDKAQLSTTWKSTKDTKLVWSIDDDDALYASISASGLLTAKNVTAKVSVTVRVTTADGQSPVASREINIYPQPMGLDLYLKNVKTAGGLDYSADAVNGQTVTLDIKDFKEGGKFADGLRLASVSGPASARVVFGGTQSDAKSPILEYNENTFAVMTEEDYGQNRPNMVVNIKPLDPDAAVGKSVKWTIEAKSQAGKRIATQTVTFNFVDQVTALKTDADEYELYSGQKQTLAAYAWDEAKNDYASYKNGKPVALTSKEVKWSILGDGEAYASITAAGQLTAKTVQTIQTVTARVELVANPEVYKDITIKLYPLVTNVEILRVEVKDGQPVVDADGKLVTEVVNDAKLYIDTSDENNELYFTANFFPAKAAWRQSSYTMKPDSSKIVNLTPGLYPISEEDALEYILVTPKAGVTSGTETVTVSATDSGKKSAKASVTVGDFVNVIVFDESVVPTVEAGGKLTLKATAYSDAAGEKISKTGISFALENASDSEYATVSASGVVTAKTTYGVHDVAIIATAKDVRAESARIVVRVEPKETDDTADTGILTIENEQGENITKTTQVIDIGTEDEPEMLRLFGVNLKRDKDGNAVYPKVTWKSSNSSIASIDPDSGVLVANKLGTATITATVTDEARPGDNRTATVTIKVTRLVKEITLETVKNAEPTIIAGKSLSVKATVDPANASTKTVTWSIISGAEYATVSTSGVVNANKGLTSAQTVVVKATAKDGGGAENTMEIQLLPETTGIGILRAGTNVENTTVTMTINSNSYSYNYGERLNDELRFLAKTYPDGASNNVAWTSSNSKVATVDENGVVRALRTGTATITVKATDGSNKSASFKLTVVQPVESLKIVENPNVGNIVELREASLGAGKTLTFKTKLEPSNPTNKKLTWSVKTLSGEMQNCATISSSGALKASAVTSEHVVEVTATAADGYGASATCLVTIKPLVTSVDLYYGADKINGQQLEIWRGDSLAISANSIPFESSQSWTWRSSNEAIATVVGTATGALVRTTTEGKAGTVTITATAADGSNKSANFKVKVSAPVGGLTLNPGDGFAVAAGKSITIKATPTNSDATNKKVTWAITSGGEAATLSASGVLKANANITEEKMVTVTATAQDGSCDPVTITGSILPAVDKVTITSGGEAVTGQTLTLAMEDTLTLGNVNYNKNGGIEASQTNAWKSSNTNIATVDQNGVVTPIKSGTVTITSTSTDGTNKSATVKVTVYQSVTSITITPPEAMKIGDGTDGIYVAAGKSAAFKAETNPDATNKKVVWSVDCDASVATISTSGTLTTKAGGEGSGVYVTAKATDGSEKEASYYVQITSPVTKVHINNDDGDVTGKTVQLSTSDEFGMLLTPSVDAAGYNVCENVKWKSSNESIATVSDYGSNEGLVIANANGKTGTVTITATSMDGTNKSATVKVTVYNPVTEVTLDPPKDAAGNPRTALAAGKSMSFKAATNSDATNKNVTWSVDNTSLATISTSGTLTAKGNVQGGEVVVTATSKSDKDISESYPVSIYPATTAVTLKKDGETLKSNTTLDLKTGDILEIAAENSSAYGEAYQGWTWKSSNTSIATVDQSTGVITSAANGKSGMVTVTATANDGTNKSASFKVRVYTPVEAISISSPNMYEGVATVATGKSLKLTVDVTPSTATDKSVAWSVIDGAEYISVNASSGAVSTKAAAMKAVDAAWVEATVQAVPKDGGDAMPAEVTVRIYKTPTQMVTVARSADWKSNTLSVGDEMHLTSACYADTKGATLLDEAPVMWRSSNESMATVDADGNVTALKPGYVVITAVSADGSNKPGTIGLTIMK